MGLLKKLPSFSKKSRPKPTDRPPLPTSPPVEPLSLKLDFEGHSQQQNTTNTTVDFNHSSNANLIRSSIAENSLAPVPAPATTTNTATQNAGASLLDDIFSELNQTQTSPAQDSLQADISLAFALSQQLQLDTTSTQQQQPQQQQMLQQQAKELPASNTLFGQDSIYSSYLNGLQREDGDQSMFASLLQPIPGSTFGSSANTATSPLTSSRSTPVINTASIAATASTTKKEPLPTQIVLDSDVSGTEDDDDDDQTSGGEETNSIDGKQRRTLGACPIMERRPHDHRLNVARNVDRWADHVEENVVESNQSMLNRMKDRHRQQVKLQAMRQQQQKHQQHQQQQTYPPTTMMYPNAAMGSMMMPPTGMNSMLCATVPPISMIPPPISAPVAPMHGSTTLPPPLDSTLTPNHQPIMTAWASEHSSSPRRSVATSSASSVDNTPRTSTSTVTNNTTKLAEDQENANNSSAISQDDEEDDNKDKKEHAPAMETAEEEDPAEENTNNYDDADDEADDEDKTKTPAVVNKRRSISTKKPPSSPSSSSIRHSRSVPDLKKKKRKSTRTNQQSPASAPHSAVPSPSSSTPTSVSTPYSVTTPPLPSSSPIPPLPQQKPTLIENHHRHPYGLKSMKSEPDMKRHSMNQHALPQPMMPQALYQHPMYQQQQQQQQQLLMKQQQQLHQQQQLQLEWERMQLYQREQQLKQEFLQLHQRSSQVHRSSTLPNMSPHLQQPLDPRLFPSYYSGTH